ncbi:hypothetical protein FISHEDRAFT_78150 [Fistulina hepatica ATCC 64428]|nr:hypothetical protein FISHEDRAFT_78150 [Fistulina hepatica ATCC 64428]
MLFLEKPEDDSDNISSGTTWRVPADFGFPILPSLAALRVLEKSAVNYSDDPVAFREDRFNIARTTLSLKVLVQDKDYFSNLVVDAVLRLRGFTNLEHIQVIKKVGGELTESYLG